MKKINYAGRVKVEPKQKPAKSKPTKSANPKDTGCNHAVCQQTLQGKKISTSVGGITPIDVKIYWHLDESQLPVGIDKYKVIIAIQRAFGEWQRFVSPLFSPTADQSKAQIVLKFKKNGDAGLPEQFEEDVLAYAYDPYKTSLGLHSDIFLNNSVSWAEINRPGGVVLWKVIVHEIGHSLGLGHSTILSDIMYPTYQPDDLVTITQDTINGLVRLYGPIAATTPSPAPAPAPSPTPVPPTHGLAVDIAKSLTSYDWAVSAVATRDKVAKLLGIVLPAKNKSRTMSGKAIFDAIKKIFP